MLQDCFCCVSDMLEMKLLLFFVSFVSSIVVSGHTLLMTVLNMYAYVCIFKPSILLMMFAHAKYCNETIAGFAASFTCVQTPK